LQFTGKSSMTRFHSVGNTRHTHTDGMKWHTATNRTIL